MMSKIYARYTYCGGYLAAQEFTAEPYKSRREEKHNFLFKQWERNEIKHFFKQQPFVTDCNFGRV